jgi:hypothetical protein
MDRFSISALVKSQLPGFVRSDYQTFIAFLEAYYDYMQQSGATIGLEGIRDLDESVSNFIEHVKNEIAPKLPLNVADNRFKYQHISDLYDAKGSTESFKMLFRMLYGEETEIVYPSKQVLIPSDGRWIQSFSVFVDFSFMSADVSTLVGKLVTIQSGSENIQVFVEKVEPVVILGGTQKSVSSTIYQIFINKGFYGQITPGSTLSFIDLTTSFNGTLLDACYKVKIINPGTGFKAGEFYTIDTATGTGVVLKINKVGSNGEIIEAVLFASGVNYTDQFTTSLFAKKYTSATPATSSISYSAPNYTATLVDSTNATSDAGYIINIDYLDPSYTEGSYAGTIIRNFADTGTTSTLDPALAAQITILIGPLVRYPGFFATNSGFISDALFIQDSYYYQAFSYVVKIDRRLDEYGGVLKGLLHPAGTKMFGEFNINDELSIETNVESGWSA